MAKRSKPYVEPAANDGQVEIHLDFDKLVIGDLELLERFQEGSPSMKELVEFLDRIVVGGARHLPLRMMRSIVDTINGQVRAASNPVDAEGKA